MRYDAECRFGQRCQNNVGSGCGHGQVEARNFREALSFLRSQKCYVRVFASATQLGFSLGDACGGWQLGDSGGRCVGGVVWFVAEQHAMRLRGEWESLGELETQKAPPWLGSIVGAPKGRTPKKKKGRNAEGMQESYTGKRDSAGTQDRMQEEHMKKPNSKMAKEALQQECSYSSKT